MSWIDEGINNTEYGITCFYIDDNNKMFAGEFSKIYWSFDNGQQWLTTPLNTAQSWVYDIISNSNGIVLAATYGDGIYRSINNGNIFNLSGLANQHVHSVEVDNNGNFYAGSDGIYKSTDTGITWTQVLSPTIISTVRDIKVTKNNIITAAGGGFYFSTDEGTTWESIPSGIENTYLTSISIDSSDNIYVGSYSGIYLLNKPLPVELLYFSHSVIDNNVTLSWTTATETNNSGFEVERCEKLEASSEEWKTIGFVNGHGTTTEPQTYFYEDENLSAGKYQYRLKQIDFEGTFEYSKIIEAEINPPAKFSLEQNYPNPFNPSTNIQYAIANRQFVSLKVYDVLGNEVASLVNEYKPSGNYEIEFDASKLSSSVYYYQLKTGEFSQTKKMTYLK